MKLLKGWYGILMLALPSLFAFATQTLTGTINLIVVGDLGFVVIAVVGVSNIIMYNVFAIFSGIGHSINYLVAQNFGANEMRKGMQRTYLALIVSVAVGLVIALAGWLASGAVLKLTGGSADLIATGGDYLELRFYAMSFGIISFVFHGFFRGVGDTRTSMIVSIVANVLMVGLTYALTYGHWGLPDLGVIGAGYALLIGEAVQLLVCLIVFWGPMHKRYQTRKLQKPDWKELKLISLESGKLGLQEFSMSISMYIFTIFVLTLGDLAAAANEVALSIMSFGFMPAFAFGSTATILVGQEIGQRRPDLAKKAGTSTAILGSIFLILLGTVEIIWAVPIARLYSDDPGVYELAAYLIQVSAYLQIFDGFYNFYAGGLRGIGDTTFLMRASFVLSIFMFIPLTYLFVIVFDWGSIGAWLALYSFLVALGLAVMIRYYRTDFSSVKLKEAHA
ncbi:MATE family efflux transporter [Cohnella cholangitidis]|uniref:Probable multidrug resistance protein NorM n=1 Tax=Cohnella cholangitidis TaxID=2598458 RepID=A0A7G5C2U7_9BACL|nr:MATE family efflux transporter [Cohnella cholangitidis]QMV43531.1 MATE family efflux transporter [Cohnella cholangitidis]